MAHLTRGDHHRLAGAPMAAPELYDTRFSAADREAKDALAASAWSFEVN